MSLPVAAAFWATSSNVDAALGVEEEAVIIQSGRRETDSESLGAVGAGGVSLLICVNGDVT